MLVLALESSTSSAKALLYDVETGVIRAESRPYDPAWCRDGVTGTEEIFARTMEMGRRVADGQKVAAVALGGVWHSVAVCDRSMRPAGGTYTWNYMKPSALCRAARDDAALTDALYRRTGCMPHVTYMRHTLRYLRENGLRLEDKLLPSQAAYTHYQMTGDFVETPNIMSGSGFLNIHNLDYDPFALNYTGIHKEQLGRLVTYRDAGALNARCAKLLGIPAGTPVVPPHADGALNQIANGAAAGRMTLSVGTSGAIRMTTERPVLPQGHQLWCYRGVADWMSGAAAAGACNCIDWFVHRFMGGKTSFDELDACEGKPEDLPVFLPFLYGERNPGWRDERMGQFLDIRPEHTSGDLYRALQAGILFNLFQCYEVLAQNVGVPDEIMVSGGILNSRRWTQMAADIFRRRIRCVENMDASCVGAAVLAMHAAGALDDIRSYTRDAKSAVDVLPREETLRGYGDLYKRYLEYYAMFAGPAANCSAALHAEGASPRAASLRLFALRRKSPGSLES